MPEHVTKKHLAETLDSFGAGLIQQVGTIVANAPAPQCMHCSGIREQIREGQRQRERLFGLEQDTAEAVAANKTESDEKHSKTAGTLKTHLANHHLIWVVVIGLPALIFGAAAIYRVAKGMGHI